MDTISNYHSAAAKLARQMKRFFNGPVAKWTSPDKDTAYSAAKAARDVAVEALTVEQRDLHVFGLTRERIEETRAERARRRAALDEATREAAANV